MYKYKYKCMFITRFPDPIDICYRRPLDINPGGTRNIEQLNSPVYAYRVGNKMLRSKQMYFIIAGLLFYGL